MLFFFVFKKSKKKLLRFEWRGAKASLRECAAISAGSSQEGHGAPAKRSNMIITIRGSVREGLKLELGAQGFGRERYSAPVGAHGSTDFEILGSF